VPLKNLSPFARRIGLELTLWVALLGLTATRILTDTTWLVFIELPLFLAAVMVAFRSEYRRGYEDAVASEVSK
jgi:hypothetical protein